MREIFQWGGYPPTGSGGGFSPTQLGSKLAAWWSADTTANGEVLSWVSSVGGFAATGLTGAVPISAATSFNGRRGLTFDGTNDALTYTGTTGLPVGASTSELWVSASNSEIPGSGNRAPVTYGAATNGQYRQIRRNSGNNQLINDGLTNLADSAFMPLWQGPPQVVAGIWDGTLEYGRVNGRKFYMTATPAALATGTTHLRIGASSAASPSFFWFGAIRHVIVINGLLTETQRQQLEGWLAWDGGIQSSLPFDHPYRSVQPGRAEGAAPAHIVNAVDFNAATPDYLTRASDLAGNVDSSTGVISFWVRRDGAAAQNTIIANQTVVFQVRFQPSTNLLAIHLWNAASTAQLIFASTAAYPVSANWRWFGASWDTNFAAGLKVIHVWDDAGIVAGSRSDPNAAFLVDYTRAGWAVAAQYGGPQSLDGGLAELYFAPGQFVDFSVQANREKFIWGGKPVNLGADGSTPLGVVPILYLKNPAATCNINSGSGGNFTIVGAPAVASTSPSD